MVIPSIFIYLAKVAVCFSLLYGLYLLFLARQNKPVANRFVLLAAIIVSLALPLLSVSYTVTKVVDVAENTNHNANPNFLSTDISDADSMVEATVASNNVDPIVHPFILNWQFWLMTYLAVVCVMAVRLVWQVVRFALSIQKNARVELVGDTKIWVCDSWGQTFSFFGLIVFSEKDLRNPNRHLLLQHELVHAHQLHSLDLLLAELFAVVFWFNPLVYWYKRSIAEVHEFIADKCVVRHGVDSLEYKQLILDCVSILVAPRVANSFSAKLLKNRFAMLTNVKESRGIYRYLLLMPSAAVLFGLFSFTVERKVEYSLQTEVAVNEQVRLAEPNESQETDFLSKEASLNQPKALADINENVKKDSSVLYSRLDKEIDADLEKIISILQKPNADLFFGNLALGNNTAFTILGTTYGEHMPKFVITSKSDGSVVKPLSDLVLNDLVKQSYMIEAEGEYTMRISNYQQLDSVLYYLVLPKGSDGKVDFGIKVMDRTVYLREKETNSKAAIEAYRITLENENDGEVTVVQHSSKGEVDSLGKKQEQELSINARKLEFSMKRGEPGNPNYLSVGVRCNNFELPQPDFHPNIDNTNLTRIGDDATSWPLSYIHESINYPKSYKPKRRNPDLVEVEFDLSEEGEIGGVMVTKGINPEVDAELVRVISQMPGWKSEKPYGKPVLAKVKMAFSLVKQ